MTKCKAFGDLLLPLLPDINMPLSKAGHKYSIVNSGFAGLGI